MRGSFKDERILYKLAKVLDLQQFPSNLIYSYRFLLYMCNNPMFPRNGRNLFERFLFWNGCSVAQQDLGQQRQSYF
jgi:hypothetical protein